MNKNRKIKTNRKRRNLFLAAAVSVSIAAALAGCGTNQTAQVETANVQAVEDTSAVSESIAETASVSSVSSGTEAITATANVTSGGLLDAADFFTERDLMQTADVSEAVSYTVEDGKTISIKEEGVYVLSGSASNAQIIIEAEDTAKVQLVLDGVSVTNDSLPCIYVKSADKVFITTTDSENSLAVTGVFNADGETNTDAVIYSKDDLVLNGVGTLSISSSDNAVSSKDDLKVTGGTYVVSCSGTAFEANDSLLISGGSFQVANCNDGLHAENDEDNTLGYVYICGGTFEINAADDAIHGTTIVQIDDGTFDLTAAEGIEATQIQINGGKLSISASDDGINGSQKSTAYEVLVEFNGGDSTIVMGAGDTDAVDSNGNLYVNGGTLTISGQSAFDFDGTGQKNGGTIIVNGQEINELTNQFMGGGGMQGGPGMGGMRQGGPGMNQENFGGEMPQGGQGTNPFGNGSDTLY
ncbi:MAG: carbohydrate-binding domain-containing protein [Parasporobacterium sp.]|nr:carbohydrate-binding domain-containing protein [Parasporobacterium sp.]